MGYHYNRETEFHHKKIDETKEISISPFLGRLVEIDTLSSIHITTIDNSSITLLNGVILGDRLSSTEQKGEKAEICLEKNEEKITVGYFENGIVDHFREHSIYHCSRQGHLSVESYTPKEDNSGILEVEIFRIFKNIEKKVFFKGVISVDD